MESVAILAIASYYNVITKYGLRLEYILVSCDSYYCVPDISRSSYTDTA